MEYNKYTSKVIDSFKESGMKFTSDELSSIEFADFGLGDIEREGLNLLVYVNNSRYCAKEMVLLPNQICPEHRHPNSQERLGKQETFRCRKGSVYLFVEGEDNGLIDVIDLVEENSKYYTAKQGILLNEGEQYTILPNIRHWFVAGEEGAVISEFSSPSDDASDIFTNPKVNRLT